MIWGDGVVRRAAIAAAVGTAMFALGGCATADAEPVAADAITLEAPPPAAETPEPTATPTDPPTLPADLLNGVGTGATEALEVSVPDGSRTITVDFTCDGEGGFSVEFGDSMALGQAILSGPCDGDHEMTWPLLPESQRTVNVWASDGTPWEAVVTFSPDPFDENPAVTAECAGFSDVLSQLQSADDGYGFYAAFGSREWYDRVDVATFDLAELHESSVTDLAPAFAVILEILRERDRVAGGAMEDVWSEYGTISHICDQNQTPLVILAEFGG